VNPLAIDEQTGFLESSNSLVTLNGIRKTEILRLAQEYIDQNGKIPSLITLCKSVGISLRTFQRHIQYDQQFKSAFREVLLNGQAILENVMFNRGLEPGGFMDRIAWLRRYFPENWNPEHKMIVAHENKTFDPTATEITNYIDVQPIDDDKK